MLIFLNCSVTDVYLTNKLTMFSPLHCTKDLFSRVKNSTTQEFVLKDVGRPEAVACSWMAGSSKHWVKNVCFSFAKIYEIQPFTHAWSFLHSHHVCVLFLPILTTCMSCFHTPLSHASVYKTIWLTKLLLTAVGSCWVNPCQRIQVVSFQVCSAFVRQDAIIMCLHTNTATHCVFGHVYKGSKLSMGNYCTWLYRNLANFCVKKFSFLKCSC